MDIRKTTMEDLDTVLELYAKARQFMQENGNPDQWGQNRPSKEQVIDDIQRECSFLCTEDGQALGTFYYAKEIEPDYAQIYDGAWLSQEPYGVMHRVASPGIKKGAGTFCLLWCFRQSGGNLRIDTHQNNIPMQNMLEKNGFQRCGIIYLKDKSPRLAYQKIDYTQIKP